MRPGSLAESSAVFWLTAFMLAGSALPRNVCAQVVDPGNAGPRITVSDSEAPHAASTRELVKRLHRAEQLLSEQNFAEGVRLLQTIVESDEDAFFFPDNENKTLERSLKLEAQSLLGRLPTEGREVYETQYGAVARRLFDDAQKARDLDGLALVARRYFHTHWGYEAAYRLAGDHLDHQRGLTAALCFERLRGAPYASGFEPYLSLKTALSWMQAGLNERAAKVLVEMKAGMTVRHPGKTLTLRGREVVLFDEPGRALAWLTALAGDHHPTDHSASLDEWTTAGGDSRRNAQSAGGSPYLNRGWRSSTVEGAASSPENDAILARTFQDRRPAVVVGTDDSAASPALPSLQPLVVDNLVVVRSIGDVRAYDLATGRLAWATGEKDQLLTELLRTTAGPQAQPPGGGPLAILLANRTCEDATFGTLTTDGNLVFAVEDLGMGLVGMMSLPRMQPFRNHNRLVAYDLKTGRAMWEVGGARSDAASELEGTYFLGAPLVLDRRLYCLAESGSEFRLLALEPHTGRLDWSQTINSSAASGFDFFRQQSGLSPSFEGEMIVCPIGSEQVVAVDRTQRSLAWRHRFQNPTELYDPRRQQMFNQQQRLAQQQGGWAVDQNRWLDSLAVIGQMRVVVTPRDSNELFCLNLFDGSLAWRKPRGEGLFVAGMHQGKVLVVGRNFVQALNIADGEPAWPEPASVPVPSGRPIVTGDYLHLPLVTAEVATISLRDGRVVARARSLAGNVPGNLVSVRGAVVSQGPDFVETFRQLDALESEIADSLAKDPDDAQSLALRGEIQLQRGNVAEAYADLKRALELKSDDAAVRSLLVGSLLEGLRVDFDAYRGLAAEIEGLLTLPDERSAYLWLTASGLKRAGEPRAALKTLIRFADPDVADRELERLDGALLVRRDRLVEARAAEWYAAAPPEARREMQLSFRERARGLNDAKGLAGIRRFLRYFGRLADVGELEVLSADSPPDDGDWLEDEFRLDRLADSNEPRAAAVATARRAQLLLAAERPRDALAIIGRLEQNWPDVVCLDGKTGSALASQWRKTTEVERELALDAPWPAGLVEVERIDTVPGTAAGQRAIEIALAGQRAPFFNETMLQISTRWQDLFVRDALGRQLWKLSLDAPIQQPVNTNANRAYVCGHFVLISIGAQVIALDTLGTSDQPGARLLWKTTLSSTGRGSIPPRAWGGNPRRRMMPFNQVGEQVGTIGPVTRDQVTLLNGHKLMALDPLSGKPLWMREGIAPGTELFGDEQLLYAVPADARQAVVYNAIDGTIVGNRALPPALWRLETIGRRIVAWRTENRRQVLALFDPWTGKDLWTRTFEDTAQVTLIELDEAAVLEPSGKFTVVSLSDGSIRFDASAEPESQLRQIHVLRSNDHYVLIANQVTGNVIPGWLPVTPQTIAIRGRIYGYDRSTGKRLWTNEVDRHGIELHQPGSLPVLTLMCNFHAAKKDGLGLESHYGLTCIDKRSGRIVFDNREFEQFFSVEYVADADQKQLELRLFKSIVRLTFTDKPYPD